MDRAAAISATASTEGPTAGVGAIKSQYFLSYAAIGAFWPFLAVVFHERGLTDTQIGWVFSVAMISDILMPFLTTALADTRLNPRQLLIGIYFLGGLFMGLLYFAQGFWLILLAYSVYRLGYGGMLPLQDGVNFSLQKIRTSLGLAPVPYHQVRVWGSIGYIFPSFLLYLPMAMGWHADLGLATSAAFCFLGVAAVKFFLPPLPRPTVAASGDTRIPSLDAARALFRPPLRIFMFAMICFWVGIAGWNSFYTVYLKTELQLQDKWLGPLSTIAVIIEIAFIFAYGVAVQKFGLRRVMLVGLVTAVLRLLILAAVPNLGVALATQVLHGPWIIALFVAPPSFINRNAADHFRHSAQGIYRLLTSTSTIVGNLVFAYVKGRFGSSVMFYAGAAVCTVALLLLWIAFHEEHREA